MLEEIVPIILDVLIEHKKPTKLEDIVESSGCDKPEVSRCLNLLYDLNIVHKDKNEKTNVISFSLIKELKGIHLAKAAQLGLDLSAFENYFKIDPKEKQLALDLATQAEKIKQLDLNKRKPMLQKRNYLAHQKTDGIYENLMLLFEATNMTLYEYIEQLAENDSYLQLLISMHQQAESSVRDYAGNLK
jgi:hypothetical protein